MTEIKPIELHVYPHAMQSSTRPPTEHTYRTVSGGLKTCRQRYERPDFRPTWSIRAPRGVKVTGDMVRNAVHTLTTQWKCGNCNECGGPKAIQLKDGESEINIQGKRGIEASNSTQASTVWARKTCYNDTTVVIQARINEQAEKRS